MCFSCEITVMKIKSDGRGFLSFVSKAFIKRHKRSKNKKKYISKIKSINELSKYFGNFFIMHLTCILSDFSRMNYSSNFQLLVIQNGSCSFNMQF